MYTYIVDGGLLRAGQDPSVTQDRSKTRDTEDNNKGGGTSLPSNHSFKVNIKER